MRGLLSPLQPDTPVATMGKYFDDIHAAWDSQLAGAECTVQDNAEIASLRAALSGGESYLALADAFGKQLRYREAIEAYCTALQLMPDNLRGYRGRAGRYLATLQPEKAKADFLRCLELGNDRLDGVYRIGLADYFGRNYQEAITRFEEAWPLCNDEMGIAVLYWHTLSAYRNHTAPLLLKHYHTGMQVGHHTAYELAVQIFTGGVTVDELLKRLETEPDDLECVIVLYGICVWLESRGNEEMSNRLRATLLARDGFWICFSYLAAWNDKRSTGV